jgi:acetyl-CoA carboxylase biotin carboxylase subunit
MISKVLVANRGEIALRIMRTCRDMGISTVAVYSTADRNSPHVKYADEAIYIGAAHSSDSYLSIDKIIQAAQLTSADAVHPGYGFLSENANFARRVAGEKLILIGPPPEAMEMMGSKIAAKAAAKARGIPLVPGTDYAVSDLAEGKKIASSIGFPLLIKASAGGGGKGMRIVEHLSQFDELMSMAVSEASSAFGDGSVFIEKYVKSPRHIEFQILADKHGNVIHLFERECSVQRRHQKIVEEAPSSILSPSLRLEMGKCAVEIAKACNYTGAGTVEFLLDEESNFYFLEMNTRLQVEHPVTELITGLDLVKEQINIADGKKLSFEQSDLKIAGHAVEVRVYAEDPANNFLPDIGKLKTYIPPQGPGIRVDDGYEEGMDIPIYYDPMIAKLITYGSNRSEAIQRMVRAIDEYQITGVETTLNFCRFVMKHDAFTSGNFDTHFVGNHISEWLKQKNIYSDEEVIGAIASVNIYQKQKPVNKINTTVASGNWKNRR